MLSCIKCCGPRSFQKSLTTSPVALYCIWNVISASITIQTVPFLSDTVYLLTGNGLAVVSTGNGLTVDFVEDGLTVVSTVDGLPVVSMAGGLVPVWSGLVFWVVSCVEDVTSVVSQTETMGNVFHLIARKLAYNLILRWAGYKKR